MWLSLIGLNLCFKSTVKRHNHSAADLQDLNSTNAVDAEKINKQKANILFIKVHILQYENACVLDDMNGKKIYINHDLSVQMHTRHSAADSMA